MGFPGGVVKNWYFNEKNGVFIENGGPGQKSGSFSGKMKVLGGLVKNRGFCGKIEVFSKNGVLMGF